MTETRANELDRVGMISMDFRCRWEYDALGLTHEKQSEIFRGYLPELEAMQIPERFGLIRSINRFLRSAQ